MRGLRGYQRVNLVLMVFEVGQALKDLGERQPWETDHDLIHRRARLDQRHHVPQGLFQTKAKGSFRIP